MNQKEILEKTKSAEEVAKEAKNLCDAAHDAEKLSEDDLGEVAGGIGYVRYTDDLTE